MANAWDNDKFGSEFQTLNDFFQKSVVIQNSCAKLLQIILKNAKSKNPPPEGVDFYYEINMMSPELTSTLSH